MADTTQNNAMAEIALALAMGFFSIMVLTMVSMGSAMVTQSAQQTSKSQIQMAENSKAQEKTEAIGAGEQVKPENLVIYYQGEFLDHKLNAVQANAMQAFEKVVLAVHPDSSMNETMKARSQIDNQDLTVVMLDESWINALEER